MAFPLWHILAAAVFFDIPFNFCIGILLSPFYYIVGASAVSAGYGLWEMRRWAWYMLLFSNVLISYENAVIANLYGESHHKILAYLSSLVILLGVTYRVAKEIRVPYFFPKIRWWESDPRYKLSVPVQLTRNNGEAMTGQIMDLSIGGCFVKLRGDLATDEDIALQFTIFGYSVICRGNVVWRTHSTVTVPRGVGVKFGVLGRLEKRHLKFINRRLKKIAQLYRRSRYLLNQQEFVDRLKEIEVGKRRTLKRPVRFSRPMKAVAPDATAAADGVAAPEKRE